MDLLIFVIRTSLGLLLEFGEFYTLSTDYVSMYASMMRVGNVATVGAVIYSLINRIS